MPDLTADLLSLARCKAAATLTDRGYAAIPMAAVYAAGAFVYGMSPGEVTDAVRAAAATGELALSKDGMWLEPLAIAPRAADDCERGADLSDRMYTAIARLRADLGVDDAVLSLIE